MIYIYIYIHISLYQYIYIYIYIYIFTHIVPRPSAACGRHGGLRGAGSLLRRTSRTITTNTPYIPTQQTICLNQKQMIQQREPVLSRVKQAER